MVSGRRRGKQASLKDVHLQKSPASIWIGEGPREGDAEGHGR